MFGLLSLGLNSTTQKLRLYWSDTRDCTKTLGQSDFIVVLDLTYSKDKSLF